ncbi:hypothetical protein CapIbe_007336, partial [Capra ibex]
MLCPGTPGDHGGARALGTRRRPASLLTARLLAAWAAASVGQGGGGGSAGRASDHFNGGSAGGGARARGTARRAGSARPEREGGGAAAEARAGRRSGSARPEREGAGPRRSGGGPARERAARSGRGCGRSGRGRGLGGARGRSPPEGRSAGPAVTGAGSPPPVPVARGLLEPTPPSWDRGEPPPSSSGDVRGHSRADVARRTFGNGRWPGTGALTARPDAKAAEETCPAQGQPGCPACSPREWFSREGLTGGPALPCFCACLQTLVA